MFGWGLFKWLLYALAKKQRKLDFSEPYDNSHKGFQEYPVAVNAGSFEWTIAKWTNGSRLGLKIQSESNPNRTIPPRDWRMLIEKHRCVFMH